MSKKEEKIERPGLVDMFPYRIKNRSLFYDRDHPVQLHPKSFRYKEYWMPFIQKCVEGHWVFDHKPGDEKNGQWVYMTGKMFRYFNYARINNADKDLIYPDMRVSDILLLYYLECTKGFSGFEDDEDFTCHHLVKRYEAEGTDMPERLIKKIPAEAKKKDGTYKKYVSPWHYLTRHYLVEHPCTKPLGLALHQNPIKNGMIGSARGIGKSLTVFVGDLEHEFQLGGVTRMKDLPRAKRRKMYALASAAGKQLQRSIDAFRNSYFNAPGKYKYLAEEKREDHRGPLYKRVQGSWDVGSEVRHITKDGAGGVQHLGASFQMIALTPDRLTVAAGDRMDVYVEEAFFQSKLITLHGNLKDTLKVDGVQKHRAIYLGTGGEITKIKEPMAMYMNPDGYDIFGIPDYWHGTGKELGLFIPKTYAMEDARDENGNIDLELAYDMIIESREKLIEQSDSVSYNKEIQFNPLTPMEMLQPSGASKLPKKEAQQQLFGIENMGVWQRRAQIGSLIYDPTKPNGVRWEKDLHGALSPIVDINIDDVYGTKDGAHIIYEQPPQYIPKNLYWVVYDPAAKAGDGESYHAALVYKYFYSGAGETMFDSIVGEWVGRRMNLDENYEEVIKLARHFNAKIFSETNTPGFVDYCRRTDNFHLLEKDAYILEREINPNARRSHYRRGVQMNTRNKIWAMNKLPTWLTTVKARDKNNIPTVTTMDWFYSRRGLKEIITYDPSGNYDVISCLLILMILLGKLRKEDAPPESLEPPDDDMDLNGFGYLWNQYGHDGKEIKRKRNGAKILNY